MKEYTVGHDFMLSIALTHVAMAEALHAATVCIEDGGLSETDEGAEAGRLIDRALDQGDMLLHACKSITGHLETVQ